jgi:ATP synthase protein I
VFFAAGAFVLNAVTSISPAASLLIAMLTYTLKIVLIGLVFVALSRSGALEGSIDARWLGGTVIACTLTWLTAQVVTSMRARVPVYDLPAAEAEAGAR